MTHLLVLGLFYLLQIGCGILIGVQVERGRQRSYRPSYAAATRPRRRGLIRRRSR